MVDTLIKIDKNTSTWQAVNSWLKDEQTRHRQRLEMVYLPEEETKTIRGSLLVLRKLEELLQSGGYKNPYESKE